MARSTDRDHSGCRGTIANNYLPQQRRACVNIDHDQYYLPDGVPNPRITNHLERIAQFTGTDIFVLKPLEPTSIVAVDQGSEASQNRRLMISIFGDYESVEHAKTRVLIMIDDLVSLVSLPCRLLYFWYRPKFCLTMGSSSWDKKSSLCSWNCRFRAWFAVVHVKTSN